MRLRFRSGLFLLSGTWYNEAVLQHKGGFRLKAPSLKKCSFAALLSFLLPVLAMAAVWFSRGVYPFGDESLLILDLNGQYVSYYAALHRTLLGDGSLLYSWSRTLGGEMMGTAAYYLLSPYNLILLFFSDLHITEAILTITLAKLGSAGLAMYFCLRRKGTGRMYSLLLSLCYSLSAYQIVQAMNPMWIDGVILAPLLLWAEERLVSECKWLPMFWVLWCSFVTNYYIGYMLSIFACLYLIFLLFSTKYSWKMLLDRGIRFAVSGLLAALSACFVLLPVLYSLRLGKLEFSSPDFSPRPQFKMLELLYTLLPDTYTTVRPEGLPQIYCGILPLLLFGLFLLSDTVTKRRKFCAAGLLALLFLSLQITTLDLVWHGMQMPNWLPGRYSFLIPLLLIVFGSEAIPKPEHRHLPKLFAAAIVFLLLGEQLDLPFLSYETLLLSGIFLLGWCVLISVKLPKVASALLMSILLLTELCDNAVHTLQKLDADVIYSTRSSYTVPQEEVSAVLDALSAADDSFYRLESDFYRCVNDPINFGYAGLSHSSSSLNARPIALFDALGLSADSHWSSGKGATEVVDALFSVKYRMSKNGISADYSKVLDSGEIKVYQNPNVLSLAFASAPITENTLLQDNSFAAQEQIFTQLMGEETVLFRRADVEAVELYNIHEEEGEGHLAYITDNPNDDSFVEYLLTPNADGVLYASFPTDYPYPANLWCGGEFLSTCFETETDCVIPLGYFKSGESLRLRMSPKQGAVYFKDALFATCDTIVLENAVLALNHTVNSLTVENTSVDVTVTAEKPGMLFTSIPYEPGWNAEIDGKPVETQMVFDSLLAVSLEEGIHTIRLTFRPDAVIFGPILSVLGLILVFLLRKLEKRKNLP